MELLLKYLPWFLFFLTGLLFLFSRRNNKDSSRSTEVDAWNSSLVAELRDQMRDLKEKYHENTEFIVNFPEVVKSMTGAISIGEVSSVISRSVSKLLNPERIYIFLAYKGGKIRLMDGMGFENKYRENLDLSIKHRGINVLLKQRGTMLLKDYPEAKSTFNTRNLPMDAISPIWYGRHLLGLLGIKGSPNNIERQKRTMVMLSDLGSVSLHAAGLVAEIKKEAKHDALTGLANRRTLMRRVVQDIQRAGSYGFKLSIVMVDVDNFKHYNDTNGHGAGDIALKLLASKLKGSIRRTDLVARYGGEEFTILLCDSGEEKSMQTAERVRRKIAETIFPFGEKQPLGKVSISMGVASFPNDARDYKALFKAADEALYKAKENGRNRVVSYRKLS